MKLIKFLIPMLVLSLFLFTGCSDDDDDATVDAYAELSDYLVDNNMDLPAILTNWITTAEAIQGIGRDLVDYYIMDIRSSDAYNLGHIPGAELSTLGGILTDAVNNGGKDILIVCYSGQSAGHAVTALRLMGYTAQVLKWGMSSWSPDFDDSWENGTSSFAVGHANWTYSIGFTAMTEHDYPTFETEETEGMAILEERVNAMLAGGFKGINATDVLAAPGDYFINNYWTEAEATPYGNIAGAYRIKEDLAGDGFMYLDPDMTIVTYCWTGQTSSVVTAYLTVLGYDAKSLKFGANGMIYDSLTGHKWLGSGDYVYE